MNWSRCFPAIAFGLIAGFGVPSVFATDSISWLANVRQEMPEDAAVTDAANKVIHAQAVSNTVLNPDLAVITYHQHDAKVEDVVVQVFRGRQENAAPLINPHGVIHDRIGDSMGDLSEKFLSLISQPAQYFGDAEQIQIQQRALKLALTGDLTLLREQTIDPLHVMVVLPQPRAYMPLSLSSHVQSVILTAELHFGEWRARLHLVTDDAENAEEAGNMVAGWRDLAGSLAGVFAGYSSGKGLRDSVDAAEVQVVANQVTASGSIPAATAVRVAKELAGHGGGCPTGAPCGKDRVAICHNGQTLCVRSQEVSGYLAEGDFCGPCLESANAGPPALPDPQ